jgi:hypothetical protein
LSVQVKLFLKFVKRKLPGEKKPANCCQTLMNKGLCLIADNGHALAMAGQFITFCRNFCPVNEQKVEIFILLLNSVFSARNCCTITNKKLMKCTSRPAIANANVGSSFLSEVCKEYKN